MSLVVKISVRTDSIVQAAGKLFAGQGFHGTSTRQIARLAGVSENTLFRHFNNKESLFWSTLRAHCAGLKFRRDLLEGIANCDAPEVVLPMILELLTDTVTYRPELLQLIAVAFIEMHPQAESFSHGQFSPALSAISGYLEVNIERGKLRGLDPTTLTAALIMTTFMHPWISKLINGDNNSSIGQEGNRAYTRFWLDLLAPRMLAHPAPIVQVRGSHSGLTYLNMAKT